MSPAMHEFQYNLEAELFNLYNDLNQGTYKHGTYKKFIVNDNKKREISVSYIRDRVAHRLVYDYLVPIYDKTSIYDLWSCRKDKGLLACIQRTQKFMRSYTYSYVWRADIKKFFDHIDHTILLRIINRKVKDPVAFNLLKNIINSYGSTATSPNVGIPIGNLTSQIFSNIYLNELDRYVKHTLKPQDYLRYGDDFLLFEKDKECLENMKFKTKDFLTQNLKLQLHASNNIIVKAKHGLKFLGVEIWPTGRRLNRRNRFRIHDRLKARNVSSYRSMCQQHEKQKHSNSYDWSIAEKLIDFDLNYNFL